jgi:hypothetical protein
MTLALLLPLAALTGCAGSVKLSDQDAFGGVSSATWFHYNYTEGHDSDTIQLTNIGGMCDKTQAYYDAYKEFDKAGNDADPTSSSYCGDIEDSFRDWAQAADAIFHDGVHFVQMSTIKGDSTVPEADTYDVGGESHGLVGTVNYLDKSPFSDALDDFDPDAQANDFCGVDLSALTDTPGDAWAIDDGSLDITSVTEDKALKGELDGSIADDDGDDAGDIAASFNATYCEIDAD